VTHFDESARGAGHEEEGSGGTERDQRRAHGDVRVPDVPGDELHPRREELDAWPLARSACARPMAVASSSPRPR
jgi:hypothetical protein